MPDTIRNIRILICDDHTLVRNGIVKLLEEEKDWIYIVGQAENGEEMIRKYEFTRPDLVLADISMPVLSGMDAAKRIILHHPEAKILFLSMLYDEQYVYSAIKVGAVGILSKSISKDELIFAIKEVLSDRKYFGPLYDDNIIKEILTKYDNDSDLPLDIVGVKITDREEEILKYVSEGLMSEEIGEKMNLGKRTIDKARIELMQKFNLKSLPALISFAIRLTENKKQ
jgi:DNA-binding NarL/FixJ family response regulator